MQQNVTHTLSCEEHAKEGAKSEAKPSVGGGGGLYRSPCKNIFHPAAHVTKRGYKEQKAKAKAKCR